MTPMNQMGGGGGMAGGMAGGMEAQPPSPESQPQPQQSPLFGNSSPSDLSTSAAKQLISEVAQVISSLGALAEAQPDMGEAIDMAKEALKAGMTKAISQMTSRDNEGQQPAYA